jgi:two-component system KDP operon response regulator KdpE
VPSGEPVIRSGDLEIDLARRSVSVNGRSVHLTPTEYELLRYLAVHAGKPVTHTTLLRQVWGDYAIGDKYNTRYVVAQLRKKVGDDPANPRYIVNEPGVGYRLET